MLPGAAIPGFSVRRRAGEPADCEKNRKVEFLDFLREEKRFSSVEELKNQIKLDLRKFKTLLEEGVGSPADGK
jgi:hypothetical protein